MTVTLSTVLGHTIAVDTEGWGHLPAGHPEMVQQQAAVMFTINGPTQPIPYARPGSTRHYRKEVGPSLWVFVVVDDTTDPHRIITTLGVAGREKRICISMTITVGQMTFDNVHYDAVGDVLYLHRGEPR